MKLQPGTYQLTQTVINPKADGRRRDGAWLFLASWPKGTEVRIEAELSTQYQGIIDTNPELSTEAIEKIRESLTSCSLEPTNYHHRFGMFKIHEDDERFAAIAAHLTPVEESIDSMFVRLNFFGDSDGRFMKFLFERGALSREVFEREYNDFLNSQRE